MLGAPHKLAKDFSKAAQLIDAAEKVIIVAHQRPDGDALGSACAFSLYLKDIKKNHDIFCRHEAPKYYGFLPALERLSSDERLIVHGDHDVLVCLDSGDLAYAGVHAHLQQRTKPGHTIINIDHHATNTHYGHLNIVDASASSTSELMFHMFDHLNHPMTTDLATCMLTGIVTDTGGFTNLATTSSALQVASHLIASGARIWDIQSYTQKNKSVNTLKLWGTALSRLTKHSSGIVTTVLTQEDIMVCNADAESIEGIANFLNTLDEAKAIAVIKENDDGTVKVSLRTTQDKVDVSRLARFFGGGGHKKAAGFTIPGRITKTPQGFQIV